MKKSRLHEFTKGIVEQNPVLVLILGTCPTLAVTTSAVNAIGMGIAATAVLICSNAVISLLRGFIPAKVRIPAYITVIAGFVTVVQMALGLYLPLIVVNCIILGRAEAFASKNGVVASVLDGAGMGVGFTAALLCMGIVRELFGAGTVFGHTVLPESIYTPVLIFILPAGGFFVFGMLIALANRIKNRKSRAPEEPCARCPMKDSCKTEVGSDG